jgi:hypothetical protein
MDDYAEALERVFKGKATILNRMRLACAFYDDKLQQKENDQGMHFCCVPPESCPLSKSAAPVADWQVMNEIALHRGGSPHLNTIDIFVDGQHLTEAVVSLHASQVLKGHILMKFSSQMVSSCRHQRAQRHIPCQLEDQLFIQP